MVLLIAAAAAYAVFLRPLDQILVNAGALILGIWGVRSVLLGTDAPPGASAVDLSLSAVVLFLLAAILARAMRYHQLQGDVTWRVHGHEILSVPPTTANGATGASGEVAPPAIGAGSGQSSSSI